MVEDREQERGRGMAGAGRGARSTAEGNGASERREAGRQGERASGQMAVNTGLRAEDERFKWTQRTADKLLGSEEDDAKYRAQLAEAQTTGKWALLDVFSDGGADDVGTSDATAQFGWCVGGCDTRNFEKWATGGGVVEGLEQDMDSNRAELRAALAVMYKVQQWKGRVRLWIDNQNVLAGLKRLAEGLQLADLMDLTEERSEGNPELGTEMVGEQEWLRKCQNRDLWEVAMGFVEWFEGRLELRWQRGHQLRQAQDARATNEGRARQRGGR